MTAHDEPVSIEFVEQPLEQLMRTGQALIDEVRAAIAEYQAPTVVTALEHTVVDGPAYITVADWDAAMAAAETHLCTYAGGHHAAVDLECEGCNLRAGNLTVRDAIQMAARHAAAEALRAARVEVQRG